MRHQRLALVANTTRQEIWDVFSKENMPIDQTKFVTSIAEKAQASFERYDTLYKQLGIVRPATKNDFKMLATRLEKIYFAICDFIAFCLKESDTIKSQCEELLPKYETLAFNFWKEWISFSDKKGVRVNPEFN